MSDSPTGGLSPLMDMRIKLTKAEDEIERLECSLLISRKKHELAIEHIAELQAVVDAAVTIRKKADGQAWIMFDAGNGRSAMLNLNNIVLAMRKDGINRGICLDALAALEKANE